VSAHFGALGGAALIYTLGALMPVLLLLGRPRLLSVPKVYLLLGSALFVAYKVRLSLSLGFASITQIKGSQDFCVLSRMLMRNGPTP